MSQTNYSRYKYTPDEIDETNGNPVVVFVHGAGSLQNVFKGFSFSYWREYMFNQYLTKKGYYVIEVDYRHSTGYGRKFREDVTGWMGKYETEDIEDGLAYLAENYAGADTSRVGVYGGSYGGFMALYTVSVSPEHFDAAAALRSVTNWENYYYTNPWYTYPRLGTPQADSANYARSSPITYADSLTKPVLILHGLIDNNVGFQDAAQYIERLIQSGNTNFDMMMYPSERHSFRDPDSWYDEYYRIFEFFQEELDNN
jgi:dipeptidyl aminopeptidase/acylaminoacyl peptidase